MKTKKCVLFKHALLVLALAAVLTALIPAVATVEVQAKTIKLSANPKWQEAPVMKKTGTYSVTARQDNSYISFVAPKSGMYKFTISNIKTLGSSKRSLGNWYPCKPNKYTSSYSGDLPGVMVKTEGGNSLRLCTASHNYGKDNAYWARKRSASIRLKKGEKIYFRYSYVRTKCTYRVTVKKTK